MSPLLPDHVLFVVISIGYTFYTTTDWHMRLRPALQTGESRVRRHAYYTTIAEQFLLAAIVAGWWFYDARSASALGLGVPAGIAFWSAAAVTVLTTYLMKHQLDAVRRNPAARQQVRGQFRGAAALIAPRGKAERRDWTIMSSVVGMCEEILYRGFLFWYLMSWMPEGPALILAAVIFGFAHLYQGWDGVIRSGILGAVFCGAYLLIGSLWVLMILHAGVDIGTGLTLSAAIEEPEPEHIANV